MSLLDKLYPRSTKCVFLVILRPKTDNHCYSPSCCYFVRALHHISRMSIPLMIMIWNLPHHLFHLLSYVLYCHHQTLFPPLSHLHCHHTLLIWKLIATMRPLSTPSLSPVTPPFLSLSTQFLILSLPIHHLLSTL